MNIFKFLKTANRALRNAGFCSRELHRLVLAPLYANIDFTLLDERASARFRNFTTLMLKRPDLASLVQNFSLCNSFGCNRVEEDEQRYEGDDVIVEESWRKAIRTLSQSEEEEKQWLNAVAKRRNDDAILGLLLPALGNLKVLDLVIPGGDPYYTATLRRAVERTEGLSGIPVLGKLEKPKNTWYDTEGSMPTTYLPLYLQLPSIKTLYGWAVVGAEIEKDLRNIKAASCHLERLWFERSCVEKNTFLHIARACNNLRSLVYCHEADWVTWDAPYSAGDIILALTTAEATLEELWLEGDGEDEFDGVCENFSAVDSLAEFKVLRYLRIEAALLLGADDGLLDDKFTSKEPPTLARILPTSLEKLWLSDREAKSELRITQALVALFSEPSQLPNLKYIVLNFDVDSKRDIVELQALTASSGVRLIHTCGGAEVAKYLSAVNRMWDLEDM